jgi:hypothetical protein
MDYKPAPNKNLWVQNKTHTHARCHLRLGAGTSMDVNLNPHPTGAKPAGDPPRRCKLLSLVLDLPWWIHTRASRMMEGHLGRAPNIIFHDGRLPRSRSLLQAWNRAQKSAFFNSLPGRGLEEPNHCRFVVSPVSPLFPWTFMRACQVRHRERLPRGQMICFGVYAANDSVTI